MVRNVSEALRGTRQTNQRAELTAVARALDHIPIDREAIVWTDSSYSIKCLTEWSDNWIRRNWKTSGGKDVENRDLIEPTLARMAERKLCKAATHLKWLKGHANHPGNVAADRLAVNGSRSSTPELRSGDGRDFSATLRTPTPKPSTAMHKFATAGTRDITPGHREVFEDAPKPDKDDADEEEIEKIFRTLADEQATSVYIDDHMMQDVPPTYAATRLSTAGAKEG
jgi:ribonuclease HI